MCQLLGGRCVAAPLCKHACAAAPGARGPPAGPPRRLRTLSWPPTSHTVKLMFLYSTVSTLKPAGRWGRRRAGGAEQCHECGARERRQLQAASIEREVGADEAEAGIGVERGTQARVGDGASIAHLWFISVDRCGYRRESGPGQLRAGCQGCLDVLAIEVAVPWARENLVEAEDIVHQECELCFKHAGHRKV